MPGLAFGRPLAAAGTPRIGRASLPAIRSHRGSDSSASYPASARMGERPSSPGQPGRKREHHHPGRAEMAREAERHHQQPRAAELHAELGRRIRGLGALMTVLPQCSYGFYHDGLEDAVRVSCEVRTEGLLEVDALVKSGCLDAGKFGIGQQLHEGVLGEHGLVVAYLVCHSVSHSQRSGCLEVPPMHSGIHPYLHFGTLILDALQQCTYNRGIWAHDSYYASGLEDS